MLNNTIADLNNYTRQLEKTQGERKYTNSRFEIVANGLSKLLRGQAWGQRYI